MLRQQRIQKAAKIFIKYFAPMHLGEKGVGYTNSAHNTMALIKFLNGYCGFQYIKSYDDFLLLAKELNDHHDCTLEHKPCSPGVFAAELKMAEMLDLRGHHSTDELSGCSLVNEPLCKNVEVPELIRINDRIIYFGYLFLQWAQKTTFYSAYLQHLEFLDVFQSLEGKPPVTERACLNPLLGAFLKEHHVYKYIKSFTQLHELLSYIDDINLMCRHACIKKEAMTIDEYVVTVLCSFDPANDGDLPLLPLNAPEIMKRFAKSSREIENAFFKLLPLIQLQYKKSVKDVEHYPQLKEIVNDYTLKSARVSHGLFSGKPPRNLRNIKHELDVMENATHVSDFQQNLNDILKCAKDIRPIHDAAENCMQDVLRMTFR